MFTELAVLLNQQIANLFGCWIALNSQTHFSTITVYCNLWSNCRPLLLGTVKHTQVFTVHIARQSVFVMFSLMNTAGVRVCLDFKLLKAIIHYLPASNPHHGLWERACVKAAVLMLMALLALLLWHSWPQEPGGCHVNGCIADSSWGIYVLLQKELRHGNTTQSCNSVLDVMLTAPLCSVENSSYRFW